MKFLILGTNQQALDLAKSCSNIADSISFYDYTIDYLDDAKLEIDQLYEENIYKKSKYRYNLKLNEFNEESMIVFDFLQDNEDKLNVISEIDNYINAISIFFTTSKTNSVSKIASFSSFSKNIVGLQYFDSFLETPIIELIKGINTSSTVIEKAEVLLELLGKESIVVKDTPGFLLNRMTLVLINEAIHLLNEGLATPAEIDKGMELALGMELGPLRLADKIGLNQINTTLDTLYKGTGNPKYLPCSLLQNMVYAGYLGRESNSGFYSYSADILSFPHLNV